MYDFLEFTEIRTTGILFWKKQIQIPLFLNKHHVECVRNRKVTGSVIETQEQIYEVRESITEVIEKLES